MVVDLGSEVSDSDFSVIPSKPSFYKGEENASAITLKFKNDSARGYSECNKINLIIMSTV